MKILVTGATGKVGSRLVKALAQRGNRVRALVRDRRHAVQLESDLIELAEGDLLDADSLEAGVRGTDVVVHCAAFFRGATAEQAHRVNALGTRRLATAARDAGVNKFIFMSTGLVYGPAGPHPVNEDAPCAPTTAYPLSKRAAEQFLMDFNDLDVRILRLAFVYGDSDPHIRDVAPLMQGWPPTQRMSIVHHADVAQALTCLLETPGPSRKVYNVVDDEAPTIAELFASIGMPPPNGSDAGSAAAFGTLIDGSRIREDLDFSPTYPRLRDAIVANAL